ncbi:CRISPR-associated helicase Cas3' [Parabacteroides sp. Marseille-P3160]|uniref:CRISPR-associated helicase Cas3' n=1 Tax=Parabacteroides sp. Marseille-P3160 TaxID=1917887 RepID=UPI001F2AF86A|nr:CRISPR-associated helicase Cas3' [Parabacteroides sp. Marseille-P3160]
MSNCYKTISDIINNLPVLSKTLLNAGNYYAHTPKENNVVKETLAEHQGLVNKYFINLVKHHQLDKTIDKLISGLKANIDLATGNYIKSLFVDAIVFHDYGKINEHFQFEKMNNDSFKESTFDQSPISSNHSSLSAFIYLGKHLNEIVFDRKQDPLLVVCCLFFAYAIFKHHGKSFDDNYVSTIEFTELKAKNNWKEVQNFLTSYLTTYQFKIHPNIIKLIGDERLLTNRPFTDYIHSFELYALCRLNFSLLTASDYLATNEYMNSLPVKDFGILTKERISELYDNVSKREWIDKEQTKVNYNKATYDALENYEFKNPKQKSGENLNVLRKEMAIEVIKNIRRHHRSNLFYIEAPTGGGKTNLSLLVTIELLKIYEGRYKKVFYVFPFTTLITQTYAVIRDMLGLKEEEIIELHSKSGLKSGSGEDDNYGDKRLNYINYLFVNYPFCLLSHIRFFDILKSNEKEANYLLHRLANSIVVIDELQSYNPSQWDKVTYFIRQYADKFNIKFILMSATLPKLDKLNVIKENVNNFVYLLPNAKELYFNNPNFAGRVNFNFDLFNKKNLSLQELADKIIQSSIDFLQYDFGKAKPKNSVYTIVEFIYKQAATDFYSIIHKYNFFDEIFVLSGTILEHRRKEIINYLKNSANRKKKIILITTQVVEAGVDIDMDLGFKDRSIIDSDEQLAGRINRNVNKEHCTLYLFNYNKESTIYGKDLRYEITKGQIKEQEYKRIIEQKDFDSLYNKIFEDRNKWNENEMAANFSEYEHSIQKLKFKTVNDDFKLIEQLNLSCFIPLNLPTIINGTNEKSFDFIFNNSELLFLEQNGIYPNGQNEIKGEEVFNLYIKSIHNKIEFTQQQIRNKVLQSIINKYTFSIFASPTIENELVHFYDKDKSDYGYIYIERWEEIYSIEQGLDAKKLVGIEETQFL